MEEFEEVPQDNAEPTPVESPVIEPEIDPRTLPHKVVNGVAVPLTEQEIAEHEAAASAPEPAPAACTMAQARKALLTAGITAAQVEAALADNPMALIDWEFQTEVRRSSPLVQSVGAALGVNVDDLFRLAVTL